jgi:membrane protease YdiL (CAAX protease family)
VRAVTSAVRRSPLVAFFVLTFVLCWGLGTILDGHPLLAPLGNFVSGVLIAALVVTAIADGRSGLVDLGRRLVRWRVGARWYGVVLILPIAIIGTVAALLPVLGGTPLDGTKRPDPVQTALFVAFLTIFPLGTPFGEEVAWRGFALPRLLVRRSALAASLALGVIWAVWHLPVVLADPALRTPAPFMLQVIPTSVLFTWIFLHTRGSIFIAVLFHAWLNVALASVAPMVAPHDYPLMWWLILAVQSAAAIVLVAILGPGLARPSSPPACQAGSCRADLRGSRPSGGPCALGGRPRLGPTPSSQPFAVTVVTRTLCFRSTCDGRSRRNQCEIA